MQILNIFNSGYGNISPRSDWGKLATIVYAIIGMPLFLLYLSNIGDVLAKSFKWIYSKVCLCRICPGVAKRRLIRERRKLRQLVINKKVMRLAHKTLKKSLKSLLLYEIVLVDSRNGRIPSF